MTPKEILNSIVSIIVLRPEAIAIAERVDADRGTILTLTVDQSDMGILIGVKGRMINSVRTILSSIAIRNKQQIYVEVTDPRLQAQ